MESLKFKQKCPRHTDSKIEYMKINNSNQSASKPFFCCLDCIDQDPTFNRQDYLRIKEIINSDNDKVLNQWLPPSSQEIITKIFEKINENKSTDGVFDQVNEFFKQLKLQINESINEIHKKMIQITEKIIQNNNEILNEYEQISIKNNNINLNEKEQLCQNLINQSQQQINTNSLQSLINNNFIYDPEPANLIQNQIINMINNIDLFKQNSSSNYQTINVKLMKTNWNNGYYSQQISENDKNQSQVEIIKYGGDQNTVSDIILNPELKYIFRIKIDHLSYSGYNISIGLIQDENIHVTYGDHDSLSCVLSNKNQKIFKSSQNKGIQKYVQGSPRFELSEENEIELRVCINEKILEVLDYPNYNHKLVLLDDYIPKLINAKDLRLYISLFKLNDKVTLTESLVVKEFP